MIINKSTTGYFLFLTIFIFLIGCENTALRPDMEEEEGQTPGVASVRFIHAAASTIKLDALYLSSSDNEFHPIKEGAVYGSQYGYYSFTVRNLQIIAASANTGIVVSKITFPLIDEQKFSVIAHDYEATIDPQLMLLNDTLAVAESGYSYVRFVHAANDVEDIVIKEREKTQTFVKLSPNGHSNYKRIAAQTYKFDVSLSDTGQVVEEFYPLTFLSEQNYTVIISGSLYGMTNIELNAREFRETSL